MVCLLVAGFGCSTGSEDGSATDETAAPAGDVAAAPSEGCDATAPPAAVENERVDMTSGGEERWYLRNVPSAAADGAPLPLVVDLHGYSEGAEIHSVLSGLGAFAEEQGFFTIFPHGDAGGVAVPSWNASLGSPDTVFFGDLLDEAESTLCIDTNRVYVTGLSNGAFMTSAVGCAYADRVAAIAPVAGIRDIDGCDPARPMPVVSFHGTADDFVSFDGGLGPAVADLPTPDGQGTIGDTAGEESVTEPADGPSIPEIVATWASLDGCDSEPTETTIADDVTLVSYDCAEPTNVELYIVDGGGHSWPGSEASAGIESIVGPTTFSIVANDVMWEFFLAHPLRGT